MKNYEFFYCFQTPVGFFWFFASIWRVTLGTFWWKPHVQKISGSRVMVQKPENWEFWSRFSNANISGTKRANRNPIGFSWRPKAVLFKCPMSNRDYLHSFSPKIEVKNAVLKRDRIYISGQSFKYFSHLCRRIILVFLCQVEALYWAHSGKNRMFRKVLLHELWPNM